MGFWPLSQLLAPRRWQGRALRRASVTTRLHLQHLEERRVLSTDGLPVVDNFDRPDSAIISSDWQERAGDFSLLDQRVVSAGSGTSLALVDGVIEADVALSAQVDVPAVGIADAGFVARSTAQGEMYVGTLVGRDGRFTAEIWRRHDGRWTNLAYQSSPAGTGMLQFIVEGQSLRLLLDGQQVAEANDDVLQAAGEVGLRGSGSATYDDLHIDHQVTPEVVTHPPADALPLIDAFDRPDDAEISPAWQELSGDFSLLAQRVVSADSGTSMALLIGLSEVDVSLSAEIEVPSVGVADAGFVLRRTDSGEMYVGTLVGRNGRFTAEIWRRHDGRWTNLAYEALSTGSGRLQFIAQGSSLRLLLDGQQVAQADDDVLSEAGHLGLRASGGAAYDELRIERWLITAIGHTIEDVTTVQLDWTPLLEVTSYHVIVTNDETGDDVFRGWVQGTALQMQLNEGSYTARVAAAEMPFAVHAFDVVFPEGGLSALSHEVLDFDTVRLTWSTKQGASAYHTIVTNTDTQVEIYRGWVYDTSLDLSLAAGSYKARVAFSGSPYRPYVFDVTAFLPGTFTPLSPIGPTNRQENHFTWFAVPDAVAYRFELRGADRMVIDSHRVEQKTETTATTPPGEYQWRVIAIGSDGEETMDVAWYSFSVVQAALDRENILGIEPDATVPTHLAVLNVPETAVRASDGTVYIADTLSNVIRRARNGQVDVFAGTLEAGYNGDGYRTDVMLSQPAELIFDADENLLVVDTGNNLIRKIDLDTGQITTVMGLPGQKAMPTDGQAASDSPLGWTTALIYDAQGNLYIPTSVDRDGIRDGDSRLFYISPDGIVHSSNVILPGQVSDIRVGEDVIEVIYGGTFQRIHSDGSRQTEVMPSMFGGGIVYRADTNTTLVGNHSAIYEFDADFNRTTFSGGFANVADVNETEDGFLVADGDRGVVIEFDIDFDGNAREIPGRSIGGTSVQGTGTIVDIARYDDDTLLFLENKKGYIYSYSISTGRTVVMAGNGRLEPATLGVDKDHTGFWYPNAIAVDSRGNVYVTENNRIIKIDVSGRTSLFAGDVHAGDSGEGGAATAARFTSIRDIAFDDQDTMYVADMYNNKIKTISPDGIVTTIAGSGIAGSGSAGADQFDKPALEANLNHPSSVLPQADGTVLFSNAWSNTLGRIDADGMLRHVAGVERRATYQDGGLYSGDGGLATEANLNTPHGLAVSPSGVIYFADTFNHVIRSIDSGGIISTVWGRGSRGFATDGSLLSYPTGIFLIGNDLFLTDNGNGLASRLRLANRLSP
ncbi:MAG: hypothetical protein IID44_20445 [Planctomycetes bacterium]|nr:hypothetical protein [Planctomycetota bacterium]